MTDRRKADLFFKHLVALVSGFSILALGAILLFVFIRGAAPFVLPTDSGIRIVTERIDEISVNGQVYRGRDTAMIPVPRSTSSLALSFPGLEGVEVLDAAFFAAEKDPEKMLRFTAAGTAVGKAAITYPEAYVYTATYPGSLPGLNRKIHIILPEPPYGPFRFLGGMDWRPTYNKVYGIFPMIIGTILAGFGAILLGVPPAILCALFLGEFLPSKAASLARGGIELLAGIPSVVYGFFGLMIVVPTVKHIFKVPSGNGLLSGIIILALMILPTVITIAETAIRAVPRSHREASLSLGASKMQTTWFVVLPHARSGVLAGVILGISRAMGETMAVILVAGNSAQLIHSPLDSVRTLTATIALEMGYAQGRHSEMLFSVGVVLFVIILLLNSIILKVRRLTEAEV
ncbi:MAG: phosphate ABC transporter permease subunit PstC [Spirochaetaceae bacterium]|jgi:phosphate transport system permease protein|nr:phosphate ABC transporter permease subunit PstC [Spirochaetaceae bacterium]